jgi:hypothetical protein
VDRAVPAARPPLSDPEVLPAPDYPSLPPAHFRKPQGWRSKRLRSELDTIEHLSDASGPDLGAIYKSRAILVSLVSPEVEDAPQY